MPFSARFNIDVYVTAGCIRNQKEQPGDFPHRIIDSHNPFRVGDISVTPVPVPHDAREPVQYLFNSEKHQLGILTDVGSLTPHIETSYANCDGLLVEANHDLDMLHSGPSPSFLKDRVAGPWGLLNNQQTARLLSVLDPQRIQQLVIGHISEKNNCLEKVREAVEEVVPASGNLLYACQEQGFDWLELI